MTGHLKSAAGKVLWVGRATVFLVGLAVILALVFGATSAALGATGGKFILGKTNLATTVSTLVRQGPGPALSLQVDSGPPLAVNSSAKVGGLNADTVDGKDSGDFATTQAEAWHEVGTASEAALQPGFSHPSSWNVNSPAFYKDPFRVVHLKGGVLNSPTAGTIIFTLPAGYRPAARETQGLSSSFDGGYLFILPTGEVSISDNSGNTGQHYLDGVTFRAAN